LSEETNRPRRPGPADAGTLLATARELIDKGHWNAASRTLKAALEASPDNADDIGNVIATESLNINAYEKVVDVASNLFSQDMSNASYIGYSSGREVVGFQLNGSSDDMMLDALPGM